MIKNYIISAWRNMMRSKVYTLINIFCLSVGITGAIFITLFVNHELSYDTFHENHKNIYRIEGKYDIAGGVNHLAITAFPLGPALKEEYSGVQEYVRFFFQDDVLVNVNDRKFLEDLMAFADSTVFDVFSFPFISGNPQGALSEPNTVVLTKSLSEKYFGEENPVGQTLKIQQENFMVTGVIEDMPSNTHLQLKALMSMSSLDSEIVYTLSSSLFWNINQNYTYILMHNSANIDGIFANMDEFHEKYTLPMGRLIGATAEFTYTPLKDVRFSTILFSPESASSTTLMVLIIVAVFLVIIASVNYTNLSTARATVRAVEIGVRKASGATRKQIFSQFLSESIFLALISLVISMLFIEIMMPAFNHLADKSFSLYDLLNWPLVFYVPFIVFLTGVMAGAYPAVFISSMRPAEILKGSKGYAGGGSGLLRKALVVFQFVISIMLITGTLMVSRQLGFLQNKDLGLETDDRAVVRLQDQEVRSRIQTLENALRQNPDIMGTTKSMSVPGRGFSKYAILIQSGNEMVEATVTANHIDHQFLEFFEIAIEEGRNFSEDMRSDVNSSVILNRTAVNYFGWHDDPLGRLVQWHFDADGNPQLSARVIGVVEDHNLLDLHHPIEPIMYILPENAQMYHHLIIHYREGKESEILSFLESALHEFDPDNYPIISFVNKGYQEQFAAEERLGTIFGVFAMVCIIISFMGLFGLSSYLTEQRRREIGVRKVLGSSITSILFMFFKEFLWLVIIASLIALPVSWYFLDRWLKEFVYRADISAEPFLFSSVLALAVAVFTVSYHIYRSASLNPVDALRAE
ncbi:MAG: ABC transporter permease [Bacteroidales bacterium]|nr:ABC transporter permease [Bacteroidales bacterium]